MKVLCVVLCCVVAAMARPQILHPWPATIAAAPMWSHGHSTPVVMARHGLWPYATQAAAAVPVVVRYPSQDTSRGLPQPVEDTPEVRAAKMAFAAEYEKAAVAAALSPSSEDIAEGSALVIIPRAESKIVPAAVAMLKEPIKTEGEEEGRGRSRRAAPKEPIMMAEKKMMLITPASTTRMGMSLDVADFVVPQHHPVIPVPVPIGSPVGPVVPVVALPGKAAAAAAHAEGAFIVPHGQPIIYTAPAGPIIPPVVLLKEKEPVAH